MIVDKSPLRSGPLNERNGLLSSVDLLSLSPDKHLDSDDDETETSDGAHKTPQPTCKSPEMLGGTGVRIILLVNNADAVVERAVAAGARVAMPVQDMFWGGRYGKIVDPFGHEWGINQQGQRTESRRDSDRGRRILRETKIIRPSQVDEGNGQLS